VVTQARRVEPPEMSAARPRFARDFFSELIKDSQAPRAGFLAEREHWLHSVQVEGREELIFEFEMLLRGVERYFNLHNLPIDAKRPVVVRDLHDELYDVRDALNEGIRIARRLLDPDTDQKMQFRHYVESQLADDRVRRALLEDELEQGTPQESLFLLRVTFESLRSVIDHLLKLDVCSFSLYTEVGNLALREIVLNRFFRPFRPLEFRLEYDRIKSVPVLESLRAIPEGDRRLFTVAFLALFRLLHYLSYVSPTRSCRRRPAPAWCWRWSAARRSRWLATSRPSWPHGRARNVTGPSPCGPPVTWPRRAIEYIRICSTTTWATKPPPRSWLPSS
jgi:hypothetical protein